MKLPLQITFRDLPHSDTIAEYVRRRATKLDTFFDRIMSCRVALESPHKHKREGRPYRIRIDLGVPGGEVVVSRDGGGVSNEDLYAAIDLAFDEAQRRLQDHTRLLRGDVKPHDHAKHGIVGKLFTYEGYGFIQTQEGDEIYFHKNSVLHGGFQRLHRGDRVRFVEETGPDGVHASTVARLPSRRKKAAAS